MVAAAGRALKVRSSVAGVVVRSPAVELNFDEDREFWAAAVRVEGRALGATALLTASLEDVTASAHVTIVRKEEGPIYRISVVDEDMGAFRGVESREVDPASGDEVRVIKVSGRHAALKPFVGESGLLSREARLIVAEVVTDTAVRLIVSQSVQTEARPGRVPGRSSVPRALSARSALASEGTKHSPGRLGSANRDTR